MNLLVTGGTGFIGTALVESLLQRGDTVYLWGRSSEKAARLFGDRVRFLARLEAFPAAEGLDAVINLAGEPILDRRWSADRKALLRSSRIDLTQQLVDWLESAETRPKVLVSGSAVGYYGNHQDDEPLCEQGRAAVDFAHCLCADWEAEACRAEALGIRVCLLRTGVVLGGGGGALARMLPVFRLGLGGPIGDGQQWFSWVQREDMVALILYLLDHPTLAGPFNATAPEPVTNQEFTRCLGAVLKRPAKLRVPAWALQLALGEGAEMLVGGQRVVPDRLLESGFQFRYPDLETALRASIAAAN